MNFQILPHWGKKLGVIMFVVFTFLEGHDDFIRGFFEGYTGKPFSLTDNDIFSFNLYFGEHLMLIFGLLSMLGMLVYMFSKEKIEDDYIQKLRLESFQLSFIFVTGIAFILYLFGVNSEVDMATVISFLLGVYLIVFAIKKRIIDVE